MDSSQSRQNQAPRLNRRAVVQTLGLASSHILFPSILAGFISSCQAPSSRNEIYTPQFFNTEEFAMIQKIVDLILPETHSKSASQVNTHHFLDEVFAKCLNAEQQTLIGAGLAELFLSFPKATNKLDLLQEIDRGAYTGKEAFAYFKMIKQYTLVGFFTSQEGMTQASNFIKFPGDYRGEIASDEQTLNYAKTNLRYYL